ncbi:HPP family protein [uncultured Pseudoalteromonas sp.]|uniref:HPP family protein n=1 Tax=uncultured Pseudoalteromonas sp. TaxID=114053 RepID=UPI0030C81975
MLVFGIPESPLACPKSVIVGHFITASVVRNRIYCVCGFLAKWLDAQLLKSRHKKTA